MDFDTVPFCLSNIAFNNSIFYRPPVSFNEHHILHQLILVLLKGKLTIKIYKTSVTYLSTYSNIAYKKKSGTIHITILLGLIRLWVKHWNEIHSGHKTNSKHK